MIWSGSLTFPVADVRVALLRTAADRKDVLKIIIADKVLSARITQEDVYFDHRVKFHLLALEE